MIFMPVNPAVLQDSTRVPSDVRTSSSGRSHTGSSGSWDNKPASRLTNALHSNVVSDIITPLGATPSGSSSARAAWTDGMGHPVGYNSGRASSARAVTQLPRYPFADIASQYGMDQATAYREALANTAHMREVEDLKRAGLNPVLSATGGNGAASFSGNVAYPMSFGATSFSGGGSASAAYSGGGSGGKKGSSASGLASILRDYNARKAVASIASAAVGGLTKSFPLGAAAYYGAQAVLGGLFSRH